ncbi:MULTISPECIES: hypothetical protein [Cupriavidus]|uniref:hypothetical protein n=1 Tax=unclassified Cupriavidus TaxID=2640874 RepID=UPI0004483064|nr:hypothetical protein [Cupriavidus sp. SK-3]KDP83609.1 preprotein translocase subunit SecD [Cupriavidus sp. SK-3]
MKPDALLPDGVDVVEVNGVTVRKGSVGAFLISWRVMNDPGEDAGRRAAAREDLVGLLPGLRAMGVFDVFAARDPGLAVLIDGVG